MVRSAPKRTERRSSGAGEGGFFAFGSRHAPQVGENFWIFLLAAREKFEENALYTNEPQLKDFFFRMSNSLAQFIHLV